MPKDLKFNAGPEARLEVAGQVVVGGGVAYDVPNDVADELLTAPYVDVEEFDTKSESREDVNERAIAAGVEQPGELRTVKDVAKAIDEAQRSHADQAEAEGDVPAGEGDTTTTKED